MHGSPRGAVAQRGTGAVALKHLMCTLFFRDNMHATATAKLRSMPNYSRVQDTQNPC